MTDCDEISHLSLLLDGPTQISNESRQCKVKFFMDISRVYGPRYNPGSVRFSLSCSGTSILKGRWISLTFLLSDREKQLFSVHVDIILTLELLFYSSFRVSIQSFKGPFRLHMFQHTNVIIFIYIVFYHIYMFGTYKLIM